MPEAWKHVPDFVEVLKSNEDVLGSTDMSDYAALERRRGTVVRVAAGLVVAAVLAAAAVAGWLVVSRDSVEPVQEPHQQQTQAPEVRFRDLVPRSGTLSPSQVEAKAEGSEVTLSSGLVVSTGTVKTVPSHSPCVVTQLEDFCYVGSGADDKGASDIYLLRDAAGSRFFDEAENLVKVDKAGVEAAATMRIALGDDMKDVAVLVFTDGSGLMLTADSGLDAARLVEMLTVRG